MNRIALSCGLALALIGLAGSAAAQASTHAPAAMTAIPQTSSASAANRAVDQSTGPAAALRQSPEPKAMAGMLAAQNHVRSQLNLSQLFWSAELAARATETAKAASARACGKSTALRAGDAAGAAVYWAAPLRMFSGGGSAQEISPSFLVSEWQVGAVDYDSVARQCRTGDACRSYARLADPEVRAVGCARNLCDSQAQVWVCQYGR